MAITTACGLNVFNDDIIGTRYMATIALWVPGCSQPSRHKCHASPPIMRERERKRLLLLEVLSPGLSRNSYVIMNPLIWTLN